MSGQMKRSDNASSINTHVQKDSKFSFSVVKKLQTYNQSIRFHERDKEFSLCMHHNNDITKLKRGKQGTML